MTTFEEFYEDTIDTVTSYLLRRCDPSDAQDVISEAYVIAWRKHAHNAPNPIGYLLLTARRVLDRTRRGQASRSGGGRWPRLWPLFPTSTGKPSC